MEQEQGSSLFGMELDGTAQQHLGSISKWGKFIAVTFIVCIALGLIGFAVIGSKLSELSSAFPLGSAESGQVIGVVVAIVIVVAGLIGALAYFLLRATTLIKKALLTQNMADLNLGLIAMKNYFVMSIVISTISILGTLLSLLRLN
jgi:hypothetical protein